VYDELHGGPDQAGAVQPGRRLRLQPGLLTPRDEHRHAAGIGR
jgi:hypothetical protein